MDNSKLNSAFRDLGLNESLSQSSPARLIGSPLRPSKEGPWLPPASDLRPNLVTRTNKCPRLTHQNRRLLEARVIKEQASPDEGIVASSSAAVAAEPQVFKNILRSPNLRKHFAVFLRSHFSEGNLNFWLVAENFREKCSRDQRNVSHLSEIATKMYKTYFYPGSIEMVSVKCSTSKEVKRKIDGKWIEATMFDDAQDEVFEVLRYDYWPTFQKHGGSLLGPTLNDSSEEIDIRPSIMTRIALNRAFVEDNQESLDTAAPSERPPTAVEEPGADLAVARKPDEILLGPVTGDHRRPVLKLPQAGKYFADPS